MRKTDFFGERRFTPRRVAARIAHLIGASLTETRVRIASRLRTSTITGSAPVIVTLTSHGARLSRVHLVIEAIAHGATLPRRIVLWVDPGVFASGLPSGLRRLQQRGLDIRESPGRFGPHTKYFPLALALDQGAVSDAETEYVVTADDDILYPRRWLERLLSAPSSPNDIVCYRAHHLEFVGEDIAPYQRWKRVTNDAPSPKNFATGVMGVRYPVAFFAVLAHEGAAFLDLCPRADDVWLHVMALRNGFQVRQLETKALNFPVLLGSQAGSLVSRNAFNGGNDSQISATYTAADVALMFAHGLNGESEARSE